MSKIFRRVDCVTAELADGTEVEIDLKVDMRDQAKYERARRSLNLPKIGDEGSISYLAGGAYFALKRAKSEIVEGVSLETWMNDRCIDVTPLDENGKPVSDADLEGHQGEPVDPTNPDHTPG